MTAPVSTPRSHPSRAGRNLPAAIAVGLVLVAVIFASLLIQKAAFVAVVSLAILYGLWELTQVLRATGVDVPVVPLAAGTIGMLVGTYVGGTAALAAAFGCTVLAVLLWRMWGGPAGYVRDTGAGLLCAAYVPFLAGFVVLMLRPHDGPWRVVTFIAVTTASDIGGYAVGVLVGRHPMAATISPKKSWEGFAGSVVACVVVGAALVGYVLHGPWWVGIVLGAVSAVTATLGDLVESLVKRDLGVKDMGALLPGHGGLMDRLDSLLATVVPAWLVLTLLVPVASR
jgi:phosphatidate cytidylyltransferase